MKLPTEIFGDVVVAHAPQDIGRDQAASLTEFLSTLERGNVILDLDNAESVDSVGLEALLDTQDVLRENGGDLKIATQNYANRKILEITRLDQHLDVFDNVIEAVKSFS